jgi:hypothetical protein
LFCLSSFLFFFTISSSLCLFFFIKFNPHFLDFYFF